MDLIYIIARWAYIFNLFYFLLSRTFQEALGIRLRREKQLISVLGLGCKFRLLGGISSRPSSFSRSTSIQSSPISPASPGVSGVKIFIIYSKFGGVSATLYILIGGFINLIILPPILNIFIILSPVALASQQPTLKTAKVININSLKSTYITLSTLLIARIYIRKIFVPLQPMR